MKYVYVILYLKELVLKHIVCSASNSSVYTGKAERTIN